MSHTSGPTAPRPSQDDVSRPTTESRTPRHGPPSASPIHETDPHWLPPGARPPDLHTPEIIKISRPTTGSSTETADTMVDAERNGQPEAYEEKPKYVQFSAGDPENPVNWSKVRKWYTVIIIASASFCATCCSSMVSATYVGMEKDFGISREAATLGLTMFIGGLGIGPLFLSPLSEFYGRNAVYIYSYFFYALMNVPVALAPNIGCVLACRFLGGFAGAAFLSVAGGSVSDMFRGPELSGPMAVYSASPFVGPVLGPIVADFIVAHTTWRWVWWVMTIWSFVEVALLFTLRETYAKIVLMKKAKRLRKETGDESILAEGDTVKMNILRVVVTSCTRAFEIMGREPMVLLLNIYTAFLLGVLYAFFSAFPIVFESKGIEPQFVGLTFIGIGIGNVIGVATYPIFDKLWARKARKLGHQPPPEQHLVKAMPASVLIPVSLFWFAWTSQPSVSWVPTALAGIPFGMGMSLAFIAIFTFLVAAYRPVAASTLGSNSFLRSMFAAAFPLFDYQQYKAMTPMWATTLFAFIALALAPLPFVFYRYGSRLRKKSKFATVDD